MLCRSTLLEGANTNSKKHTCYKTIDQIVISIAYHLLYRCAMELIHCRKLQRVRLYRQKKNAIGEYIPIAFIIYSWQRPTFPQTVSAVSSAKRSLTSEFGMGSGVPSSL